MGGIRQCGVCPGGLFDPGRSGRGPGRIYGQAVFDAQRPEEGVLGTGYAMELEEYQRILETAGKSSLETQANPDRTTEQCCIVVLSAEG